MALPHGASFRLLFAFLFHLCGSFLHLVAVGTKKWSVKGKETWSLLYMCDGTICIEWPEYATKPYGWKLELAVQLNILGLFLQCATLVLTLVYLVTCLFTLPGRRLRWLSYGMASSYLLSLTMVLVGTSAWYYFIHKPTVWEFGDSFRSACVGETFLLVAGLLAATGRAAKPKPKTE